MRKSVQLKAHPDPLIYIINTDAYFIIQDCYIKQLASEVAVYFNSTAHAKMEYSTIVAAWLGIYFDYAENTVIDHVDVRAETYRALWMDWKAGSQPGQATLGSIEAFCNQFRAADLCCRCRFYYGIAGCFYSRTCLTHNCSRFLG